MANLSTLSEFTGLAVAGYTGDLFFQAFKKRHDKLLRSSSLRKEISDHPPPGTQPRAPCTREEIRLVLRLWAGDLKRPSKNGAARVGMKKKGITKKAPATKALTLYEQAHKILKDPFAEQVCSVVSLALAWDTVKERCGERATCAEESTFWNEESNEDRSNMWMSRHGTMSDNEGLTIDTLFKDVEEERWSSFDEDLEGLEELDCM